jgi:hypothetical protein
MDDDDDDDNNNNNVERFMWLWIGFGGSCEHGNERLASIKGGKFLTI